MQDGLVTCFTAEDGSTRQPPVLCTGGVDLPRGSPAGRWLATTKRSVAMAALSETPVVCLCHW